MNELEKQFFEAIDEYTCSCTVVITSDNPEVPHGSGVAVKCGDNQYILTAAHVLRNEPDNTKLRIIGRADGPLQMLRGKQELAEAILKETVPVKFSSAASVTVLERLCAEADDIGALKVVNLRASLPHTMLHDLSAQGEVPISPGEPITIFAFPGELAKHYEHRTTGRRGWSAFPHITVQTIQDISKGPGTIDHSKHFITDFDYPEEQCDPHGMSGCGGWNLPLPRKGEIWSPHSSQLLGIQIGHYETRNVLQFVRFDRVLRLLSTGR